MKKQTIIIMGTVGIVMCLLSVCAVTVFLVLFGGVAGFQSFVEQFQSLAQISGTPGTHPPEAVDAREALAMQVGPYTLDKETIQPVETFYEFHVDDDAYVGTYEGPDGEVELTVPS